MTKQEFINWIMTSPNIERIYKNYVQEFPDKSYAAYLDTDNVEIPVVNQKPVPKQKPVDNRNIFEKIRDGMGWPGSPWYEKYMRGQSTGGAAPATPYDETLDKISFNPGLEDLWHRISGESEEAQAKRLQDDNIYQRKYIDSNYIRYPQFYRNIINPGYEKDIQDRTKYMQDRGLNT